MLLVAALLQELVSSAQSEAGIKLEFLERAKGDDGSSKIDILLGLLKDQDGANVGTLPKVEPSCKASRSYTQAINKIHCPKSSTSWLNFLCCYMFMHNYNQPSALYRTSQRAN